MTMTSVFARGNRLYAKIKDINGEWRNVSTRLAVGNEAAAEKWAAEQDLFISRERAKLGPNGPLTVAVYADRWIARRKTATVKDDETRLELHVLPRIGPMLLADVKPRHMRDLIMDLRHEGHLSPRTVREISGLMHTMFKSALIEELVTANPCVYERGVLPKKVDKDPTWRPQAIFTRAEVEQIISDARLPDDRRVLYALKFFTGRHTEVATLTWSMWDAATAPLGALNLGKTKSGVPRQVPVHPTLAKILAAWKLSGWAEIHGRAPKATDLIVPTRAGVNRKASESQKQFVKDLGKLGLRQTAGAKNKRRGHDLRRTLITLARSDGAIDSILRLITHGPKANDMLDVYSTIPWEILCTELSKLKVRLLEGKVLTMPNGTLGTDLVQSRKTGARGGLRAVKERPQRDSKACPRPGDDTISESNRTVKDSQVAANGSSGVATAPRLGAAQERGA